MKATTSTKRRRTKNLQMFEIAEEVGCTLEELVGVEQAKNYPRNMFEVEFLRIHKKLSPLQQASLRAVICGLKCGVMTLDTMDVINRSADPLGALLEWCNKTTPAQRSLIEAEWHKAA